jgi:hypothetical protein
MDENYYRRRFLIEFLYPKNIIKDKKEKYFEDLITQYINNPNETTLELQNFIGDYLKNEHTWMTSIGLIEAMDKVIESVKEEGYIK